jgi:hypothetical protein
MMRPTSAIVITLLAAAACGGPAPATPTTPATAPDNTAPAEATAAGAITEIVFAFQDASVPPPYHRSWEVTITPTSIRKVVDSYGDVLSDATATLTAAQFDEIVAALGAAGLTIGDAPPLAAAGGGCTGGTGHSLRITRGDAVTSGSVEHCGGDHPGTLRGDVDAFTSALAAYLPPDADGPTP